MPTFDELTLSSAQLFELAASGPVASETTPSSITSDVLALAAELSDELPIILLVENDPCGLYGWCSDGVEEKIRRHGGSIRFGWLVWEWPRVMLTAEFHAVWLDQDGHYHEITPKPHRETHIVFVPDSRFGHDFDFGKRPANKRHRIYSAVDQRADILERIARMKPTQKAYESKRAEKAGLALEEWLAKKLPADPLPQLIDNLIDICAREETERDGAEKLDHALLLGDHKLLELMATKQRLIKQIKIRLG